MFIILLFLIILVTNLFQSLVMYLLLSVSWGKTVWFFIQNKTEHGRFAERISDQALKSIKAKKIQCILLWLSSWRTYLTQMLCFFQGCMSSRWDLVQVLCLFAQHVKTLFSCIAELESYNTKGEHEKSLILFLHP